MNWKEIILIALMSGLILAGLIYFQDTPWLADYLNSNSISFKIFIGVFVALIFVTGKIHHSSLDITDDYTARTVKISIINIIVWSLFWLCWCSFNLIILFNYPFSLKLYLISFIIAAGPGTMFFGFGLSVWLDEQENWDTIKSDLIAQGELEAVEKAYRLTYSSMIYGIITVPLFLFVSGVYYGLLK